MFRASNEKCAASTHSKTWEEEDHGQRNEIQILLLDVCLSVMKSRPNSNLLLLHEISLLLTDFFRPSLSLSSSIHLPCSVVQPLFSPELLFLLNPSPLVDGSFSENGELTSSTATLDFSAAALFRRRRKRILSVTL